MLFYQQSCSRIAPSCRNAVHKGLIRFALLTYSACKSIYKNWRTFLCKIAGYRHRRTANFKTNFASFCKNVFSPKIKLHFRLTTAFKWHLNGRIWLRNGGTGNTITHGYLSRFWGKYQIQQRAGSAKNLHTNDTESQWRDRKRFWCAYLKLGRNRCDENMNFYRINQNLSSSTTVHETSTAIQNINPSSLSEPRATLPGLKAMKR